jgi:hypothetical protein
LVAFESVNKPAESADEVVPEVPTADEEKPKRRRKKKVNADSDVAPETPAPIEAEVPPVEKKQPSLF